MIHVNRKMFTILLKRKENREKTERLRRACPAGAHQEKRRRGRERGERVTREKIYLYIFEGKMQGRRIHSRNQKIEKGGIKKTLRLFLADNMPPNIIRHDLRDENMKIRKKD